jgi:glycosyltransferase involved in cell wall biosynthesis
VAEWGLRLLHSAIQSVMDPIASGLSQSSSTNGRGGRPISVLHVGKYYPPHVGGMETHLRDLASRQSALFPVEVVVANERPVTQIEVRDGVRVTRVASFGTLASQPICPTLPWHLVGRNESIVHLHLPNPWAAQAYLMSGHKGKLIVSHHADTLGRARLRKFVDPFVRQVMRRASAIIVESERYLRSSEELAGFRDKCQVVPCGIDVEEFETDMSEEVRAIQAKYGTRLIVAVGRLVPYKGFEFLLQAMQSVDATLLLIGDGPLRKPLETARETLGIANKTHLLGRVENVGPYYKAGKIFVLPSVSRAEAFGLVQLEAMAAGIPVVNTDIDSGVPEVSLDGVTGITVAPNDVEALGEAIRVLLNNDEMRSRYGRAARARVHEEFSARQMAHRTIELYAEV